MAHQQKHHVKMQTTIWDERECVLFLQQWNNLVAANTEVEFEKQWKELSNSFDSKSKVLEYLSNTWLIYKDRFVNAWTSRYLHFGNKATSRVEGAHAYVKHFLQVSTGDLLSVLSKLTLAIEHQLRTEETHRSRDKLLYLTGLPSTFTPVSGILSAFALKRCLGQFKRNTEEKACCTMVFTSTMGIPCAHKLKEIENSKRTWGINDFYDQWHLDWRRDVTVWQLLYGVCIWLTLTDVVIFFNRKQAVKLRRST